MKVGARFTALLTRSGIARDRTAVPVAPRSDSATVAGSGAPATAADRPAFATTLPTPGQVREQRSEERASSKTATGHFITHARSRFASLSPSLAGQAHLPASRGPAQGGNRTRFVLTFALALLSALALFPSAALAADEYPGQGFLPDNRAWEQVSPPDKHGGDIMAFAPRTRVSDDGDAVTYASLVGFADVRGTGVAVEYMAQRAPGGWTTHAITPIVGSNSLRGITGGSDAFFDGEFSADLSQGIFASPSPLTDDPNVEEVINLYRVDGLRAPGEAPRQLLSLCPVCETAGPLEPTSEQTANVAALRPILASASPDMNHILFESRRTLTEGTVSQPSSCGTENVLFPPAGLFCWSRLYEWENGTLRLAGVLPDESAADFAVAGTGAWRNNFTANTISDGSDGHSRIFFTQPTDEEGKTFSELDVSSQAGVLFGSISARGNIFMRVDHADTVQLNSSERTVPDEFSRATFLGASHDGTRAFFMTRESLTDDANGGERLTYMYDATKPESADNLTLLTPDTELADQGDVRGVVGISDNGHFVYLAVVGQLIPGGPTFQNTIYRWHDGDLDEVGPVPSYLDNITTETDFALTRLQTDLTPDGRHLVFSSRDGAGFGGYDHGNCNLGCREFYIYSADDGGVQCVSCNPSGAAATVDAELTADAIHGGARVTSHRARAIIDDGSRVFFSSAEKLVPEDINGHSDAYQYDTETEELSLISSGESPLDSWFVQASPDGRDVFFATNERLVSWDLDDAYDLYDARAGGGIAEPAPPPPGCAGDACQPPALALNDSTPASSSFKGAGNETARKCPKGKRQVRRNGKVHCQRKAKPRRAANSNRKTTR